MIILYSRWFNIVQESLRLLRLSEILVTAPKYCGSITAKNKNYLNSLSRDMIPQYYYIYKYRVRMRVVLWVKGTEYIWVGQLGRTTLPPIWGVETTPVT